MHSLYALTWLGGLATVSAKRCVNLTVPIAASGRNGIFSVVEPKTEIDVLNFILDQNQQGINGTQRVLKGYATVSGNYSIAATYCEPDSGPSDIVQVMTHGIGFDRLYWDVAYDNYNYSYTNAAVDKYKYSTFAYDRLGTGNSSHGDPITEIQSALQVAILAELTNALRAGTVSGVKKAYKKVIHVGHSYGSFQSYILTAMYPNISDAMILTGFSHNSSYVPYFEFDSSLAIANTLSPAFTNLPNGYLAPSAPTAVQVGLFAPGTFDPNIFPYINEIGAPVAMGELLTLAGTASRISSFTGPALVITGERDLPFCGGNCYSAPIGFASIPAASAKYLPDAKPFRAAIVPGSGHGLNVAYTAQYTYNKIHTFLSNNGLAPGEK